MKELPLNQIIHGDCLEVMKTFPDKSVDLVLTDPPYGLNSRMKGGTWGGNDMYKAMTEEGGWDELIPQEYFDEIYRISKNQIIWGGNYYSMPPSRCWLAWEKTEKMDTLADFEMAWTSFDKLAKMFKARRNPDGKRNHPTQKPVDLMKWCLQKFSNENDLILDPFGGSCTTAVACKQLKRNYICIEKEAKYVSICHERLKQELLF
jgi:site-specific DNA-methyltransferase (adenine-specific)